jgi:hypothetical protein
MNDKPDILHTLENEGINLKRSGRSYRGMCPFHEGQSAALAVYPSSQSWYCYGCSEGGDVISFIQKLHGYDFKNACQHLGITPGTPAPIDPEIQRRRNLQKKFSAKIKIIYDQFCSEAIELHKIRLAVQNNPATMKGKAIVSYCQKMAQLAEVDHYLDELLRGDIDTQIEILRSFKC